jgi:hypothetical protein
MLKILNTVENNNHRWDLKGKVSFSKVINWVFREERHRGRMISPFLARNGPPQPEMTLRARK